MKIAAIIKYTIALKTNNELNTGRDSSTNWCRAKICLSFCHSRPFFCFLENISVSKKRIDNDS